MSSAYKIIEALGGRWNGSYGTASCPCHPDDRHSFSATDGTERVIFQCFAGCDWHDVRDALLQRGLLGGEYLPPNADKIAWDKANRRRTVQRLWRQKTRIRGSIAEIYLRDARKTRLPEDAEFTFGYLAPTPPKYPHPTMIARFGAWPETTAVHLTYLKPDGSGKADCDPQKRIIGSPDGLPINVAWLKQDSTSLIITEGIEDALTMHEAVGLPTWAAGSAPMLPHLIDTVPETIETVTICVDDDVNGRKHSRALASGLIKRGIEVRIIGAKL
jgi:hypothetical protein